MLRIENLDVNNIAKVFVLRKELMYLFKLYLSELSKEERIEIFKETIMDVISSLTEEEKEEIGLIEVNPYKTALRQLIKECQEILAKAEIGTDDGNYPQSAADEFSNAITTAQGVLESGVLEEEFKTGLNNLQDAKDKFLDSLIDYDKGIDIDGTWVGPIRPENYPDTPWIPAYINHGYWISLWDIPDNFPNKSEMTIIYGLYLPDYNKAITNYPIPADLEPIMTFDQGVIYNNKLYADTDQTNQVNNYLYDVMTVTYVDSQFVTLNISGMTQGMYLILPNSEFTSLSGSLSPTDMSNKFYIIGLMSESDFDALNDTTLSSDTYVVNNSSNYVANFEENTSVEDFLSNLEAPEGATIKVIDANGEEKTDGLIVSTDKVIVTSKSQLVSEEYTVNPGLMLLDFLPITENGKYHSTEKPESLEEDLTWVPAAVINGNYISQEDIPQSAPSRDSYNIIVGTYNPNTNTIFTRQDLSEVGGLEDVIKVDGAVYRTILWSATDNSAELTEYLGEEITFVETEYVYREAEPPLINEDGYLMVVNEKYLILLPTTMADLKKYFNAVAIAGVQV